MMEDYDIDDFKIIITHLNEITETLKITTAPFLLAPNIVGVFIGNKSLTMGSIFFEAPHLRFEKDVALNDHIGILYDFSLKGKENSLYFITLTNKAEIEIEEETKLKATQCACEFGEREDYKDEYCIKGDEYCSNFAGVNFDEYKIKCAKNIWVDGIEHYLNSFLNFSEGEYFFKKITEKKEFLPCLLGIDKDLDKHIEQALKED